MANVRSRNWEIEINYFEPRDIDAIVELSEEATYGIYALEGVSCDCFHPHIHVLFHFKNDRWRNALKRYFDKDRLPHMNPVRDMPGYIQYCKGYDKGELKCPHIQENVTWFEFGQVPENGKKKTVNDVLDRINKGAQYKDLLQEYPAFMLHHSKKVKQYISDIENVDRTEFYYYIPDGDMITEIVDILGEDISIITELNEIEGYEKVVNVVYIVDSYDKKFALWARGMPIMYKYGYEVKKIKCKRFIFVSEDRHIIKFIKGPCIRKLE